MYAIFQLSTDTILSIGNTPRGAARIFQRDAGLGKGEASDAYKAAEWPGLHEAEIACIEISDALAQQVREHGGAGPGYVIKGRGYPARAITRAEDEAEAETEN